MFKSAMFIYQVMFKSAMFIYQAMFKSAMFIYQVMFKSTTYLHEALFKTRCHSVPAPRLYLSHLTVHSYDYSIHAEGLLPAK